MRPVNLIPPEDRRHRGVARTGPLPYLVVGALAALVVGVVLLVVTSNQVSERESELAGQRALLGAVTARATRLAPYADFQRAAEQRTATIAGLADSRFDWERVIRELSLILPPRVWLNRLTGSAAGGESGAVAGVDGPSLQLDGCASGQDTVAAFVASLQEIDGVTRVGLSRSTLGAGKGSEGGEGCGRAAQFSLVVAFDGAPPSPDGAGAAEPGSGEGGPAAGEPSGAAETAAASTTPAAG